MGAGAVQATTITLVRPASSSAEVTETLSRLRGELHSLGFEPLMASAQPSELNEATPSRWPNELVTEGDSGAVIHIVAGEAVTAVNVWIRQRPEAAWQMVKIAPDPLASNQPESLALRAIEALRAGLLMTEQTPPKGSETVAEPRAVEGEVGKIAVSEHRWGLEAGAGVLMSFHGAGPALLPIVRIDWAPRPSLVVQAAWAGPGSRATVSGSMGKARIAQQFGLLGACYRLRHDRRVWPFLGLAAGVMRSSIEGRADPGAEARSQIQWSFLLDAALGAGLRLSPRFEFSLAAHVQGAEPSLVVHVADAGAATAGRPNLLLALTLGAWL
jgi:hypothetical protein